MYQDGNETSKETAWTRKCFIWTFRSRRSRRRLSPNPIIREKLDGAMEELSLKAKTNVLLKLNELRCWKQSEMIVR